MSTLSDVEHTELPSVLHVCAAAAGIPIYKLFYERPIDACAKVEAENNILEEKQCTHQICKPPRSLFASKKFVSNGPAESW
jgi:hypothetical protein